MTLSYQNKLFSFDPKISYRSRTLDELNSLCSVINDSKLNLSRGLQYYLRKYKELLDIPRLCRALAVPGNLAEEFIEIDKPRQYLDGLDKVSQITNQISVVLDAYVKDRRSGNFAKTELTTKQKDAIYTDINELSVYLKMYYDIESVRLDSLISGVYPYGNTFDHVVNIMKYGAIIIRFKYVSRNGSLPPQERVVSYHIMDIFENENNNKSEKNNNNQKVLGVHIEGDPKFSMYKKWGEGDDKLRSIYSEYENTIIRWGKDEAEEAALYRDKKYNKSEEEFLY
ncbi:MAG: hypothetical protein M3250_07395 [Thermoproteota archaeon]|nr:hypothetical protein [Thermoproteota archaeon]